MAVDSMSISIYIYTHPRSEKKLWVVLFMFIIVYWYVSDQIYKDDPD